MWALSYEQCPGVPGSARFYAVLCACLQSIHGPTPSATTTTLQSTIS